MQLNLVIAPHADDEVLGCGGVLDASCFVYVCGVDEGAFREDKDPAPVEGRLAELQRAAEVLGFEYEVNRSTRVNRFTEQELIDVFEDLINTRRPQRVYLPHPGYNQDHRTVYNAALVALRPHDRNFFVKQVLVYEAAHDVIWPPPPLELNYFIPIDIERKLQAYACYGSQVRAMRSSELIRHIAAVRGAAAGVPSAEAFKVLRWVETRD